MIHPYNNCTNDYLKRFWTFNQSGITSYSTNNTFGYDNGDIVGTEANIYGAEWNGISWTTFSPVNAAGNFFKVNNVTAYKEYSGGGQFCIGDFGTVINVKVYLEGPYIGGGLMRTNINSDGLIPSAQPYNTSQYNYNGTEFVGSIPAGVVDWVYLEIRSTDIGAAIPGGRRAAFVKEDGSVVDLDGLNPVKITGILPGNYYVVVGHRNHLPIMSANALTLNTSSPLFDFSTSLLNVYGGEEAALGSGVLGMYSGDANKSFLISAADYTVVTNNLLSTIYNYGDLNLSGVVTAADYPFITRNLLKSSNVPNF